MTTPADMYEGPTLPEQPRTGAAESVAGQPSGPAVVTPARCRRWFRWLWLLLPVLCATLLGVGYLLVALRREPEFYRRSQAALQDAPERRRAAAEFTTQAEHLVDAVQDAGTWQVEFTEQQVNAWLWEELPRRLSQRDLAVVREPLVEFGEGTLLLGARVNSDEYRGVLSVELRPHLDGAGRLVLDIESIRAGDLPIPAHRWITEAAQQLDQSDWPVHLEQEPRLRVEIDLRELGAEWSPLQRARIEITPDVCTVTGE